MARTALERLKKSVDDLHYAVSQYSGSSKSRRKTSISKWAQQLEQRIIIEILHAVQDLKELSSDAEAVSRNASLIPNAKARRIEHTDTRTSPQITKVDDSKARKANSQPFNDGNSDDQQVHVNRHAKQICGSMEATTSTERSQKYCTNIFTLNSDQMGDDLTLNLSDFITDDMFVGKIEVGALDTDWLGFLKAVRLPESHDYAAVRYETCNADGVTRLFRCSSSRVIVPNFSKTIEQPSEDDIDASLEVVFTHPPKKWIPYYVGKTFAAELGPEFSQIDSLLHPGKQLAQLANEDGQAMEGVNEVQIHIGERFSGTAFHCEDGNLRSCNYLAVGYKLWLRIPIEDTTKFEDLVESLFPYEGSPRHDQTVRHISCIISPRRLEQAGIRCRMDLLGPGTMMLTEPREYHCVINLTPSLAISSNLLLPHESFPGKEILVCSECGLYPLHKKYAQITPISNAEISVVATNRRELKRPLRGSPYPRPKRSKPDLKRRVESQNESARKLRLLIKKPVNKANVDTWQRYLESQDKFCEPFLKRELKDVKPLVVRMALAAKSRFGIRNLFEIVQGWRSQDLTARALMKGMKTNESCRENDGKHAKQLLTILTTCDSRSKLYSLLLALGQIEFARIVGFHAAKDRLNDADWDSIRLRLGLPDKTYTNRHLSLWRNKGKTLGDLRAGWLCLIPAERTEPYHVSLSDLKDFSKDDIKSLKLLLKDGPVQRVLDIGEVIIDLMFRGQDIPVYSWERRDPALLLDISHEELQEWLDKAP